MPLFQLLLIMGGVFVALGIIFYFWGRYEENRYYETIVHRFDVREYIERLPFRPEPGALRIGGVVMLIIGVLLLITGGILWYMRVPVTP